MARLSFVFALALTFGGAVPASAQQEAEPASLLSASQQPALWQTGGRFPSPVPVTLRHEKRPSLLVPMYVSFAALQALDYRSTTRAIESGAGREGNPVMAPIVGNRAAFIAVKAATAAGTIWAGEKLWKRNRTAAVVLMGAMNGAIAGVVAHNMSVRR